jgi:hypothetical protein
MLSIGLIDIAEPVDVLNPAADTGLMRYLRTLIDVMARYALRW